MRPSLALTPVFTLVLVIATPAAAQGCGPTRLKVMESVTLDMTPDKAWRLVGDFQTMSWARNTLATRGAGGNEPEKATRTVTLRGGSALGESLYKYDAAAMSYSYHIDTVDLAVLPVQNTSATIEVVPAEGGAKATVRWRAAFYRALRPDEPAPDVADANAAKAMTTFLHEALEGLKAEART